MNRNKTQYEECISLSAVIALALFSAFVRLHGVTENGIIGSDTFQYWDIALMWKEGHLVLNNDLNEYRQYFRPGFYLLNLISLYLFGVHDYSIRLMIGIFETINIILAFFVGRAYTNRAFGGLLTAILYALLPSAIFLSQIELPHTYSATFTLLSYLFLLTLLSNNSAIKWSLLAVCGFFSGLASITHGSLSFLAPAFIAILWLHYLPRAENIGKKIKVIFSIGAVFTLAFFLNHIIAGAFIGYEYMIRAITSESEIRANSGIGYWKLVASILFTEPMRSLSKAHLYAMYASAAYLGVIRPCFQKGTIKSLSPLIILAIYSLIYALALKDVFYTRLFLPLNIFIILPIALASVEIFRKLPVRLNIVLPLVVIGWIGYYGIKGSIKEIITRYEGKLKGEPKAVYESIGTAVNGTRKLLVAPYIHWVHRPQFKSPIYFGNNAVYLIECKEGDLASFVKDRNIKYIWIGKDIDRRIIASKQERYMKIGACTGMDKKSYNLDRDIEAISGFIAEKHGKRLPAYDNYGKLFELP